MYLTSLPQRNFPPPASSRPRIRPRCFQRRPARSGRGIAQVSCSPAPWRKKAKQLHLVLNTIHDVRVEENGNPALAYLSDVLPVSDAAVQQRRQQLRLLLCCQVRLQEAEVALDHGVAVVGAVIAELAAPGEAVGAYPGSLVGGLAVLKRYSSHSNATFDYVPKKKSQCCMCKH